MNRGNSLMNKFTAAAGVAALCALGVAGVASSHHAEKATASDTVLMSDSAGATTTFTSGTSIISANGDYQLLMTAAGNLVERSLHGISPIVIYYSTDGNSYAGGGNVDAEDGTVDGTYVGEGVTRIWQSGTGSPGARAVLQGDGNFVIYSASNAVLWASNTAGNPGTTLAVQNDGNVVLYDNGRALWATKTVSITDGHGSSTVNFRTCPGVVGDGCGNPQAIRSGTGVTMLCWESVPPIGWGNNPPPSNKWFYALIDGSQDNLGYLNASVVDHQIKTPACIPPIKPGQAIPPVPATPSTVPPVTSSPPPPVSPPVSTTYTETVGGPTHTWTNYSNAGGTEGATVPTGQSVQVACVVQGFKVADGNTNWYRIASSPWNSAYYASADAFYNNGATSGSLNGTPYVDPKVAACSPVSA
jgi:hypothetical protein